MALHVRKPEIVGFGGLCRDLERTCMGHMDHRRRVGRSVVDRSPLGDHERSSDRVQTQSVIYTVPFPQLATLLGPSTCSSIPKGTCEPRIPDFVGLRFPPSRSKAVCKIGSGVNFGGSPLVTGCGSLPGNYAGYAIGDTDGAASGPFNVSTGGVVVMFWDKSQPSYHR